MHPRIHRLSHCRHEQKQARPGENTRLLPTDHGEGSPMVAGVLWTLLQRLTQRGGAIPPSMDTGYTVPFDPEQFKLAALDMLDEDALPAAPRYGSGSSSPAGASPARTSPTRPIESCRRCEEFFNTLPSARQAPSWLRY